MRFGTVTSWVAFHLDVQLDGCQTGEHFPVFDPMGVPKNTVVIYSPKKGSLAAMVVAGEKTHQAFRSHCGFTHSNYGFDHVNAGEESPRGISSTSVLYAAFALTWL